MVRVLNLIKMKNWNGLKIRGWVRVYSLAYARTLMRCFSCASASARKNGRSTEEVFCRALKVEKGMYTPSFWQLKKVRPSQFTYITSSFRAMKMHKLAQSFWKLCSTLKHHCRGRNCKNAHKCTKSSQIDQVLPTLICPREILGLFMVRWRLCTLSTISSIFSDFSL